MWLIFFAGVLLALSLVLIPSISNADGGSGGAYDIGSDGFSIP